MTESHDDQPLLISPWWDNLATSVVEQLTLPDVHHMRESELRDFDVIIVGAGIAGLSAAAAAAGVGAKTLVLEKAHKIGFGATGRNAGILSAGINMPLGSLDSGSPGAALWSQTVAAASELLSAGRDANSLLSARQTGALSLSKSASASKRLGREKRVLQANGFDAEILTPREVSEITSGHLCLDGVDCALWLPNDGRIQPLTLLAWMARQARKAGAVLVGNARVTKSKSMEATRNNWTLTLHDAQHDGLEATGAALVRAIGPTNKPNSRIYAMAFEANLPDDFPLFWDANPYEYYDYRPGDGRIITSGGRYGKAGARANDDKYHKRMHEAARKWLPGLDGEPTFKWAVDLHVTADLIPCISPLAGPRGLSVQGLGSLGVLPGIVLGREAGLALARATQSKLSV